MKHPIQHRFTNLGFSTILLALSMICIITFSALALITANSDYRLSQKTADMNSNYYHAEELAYDKIAMIDQLLQEIYLSTYDSNEFCQEAKSQLSQLTINNSLPELTEDFSETGIDTLYCHFSEPISSQQHLAITLSITYPQTDSMAFFTIVQWQTVNEDFIE